MNKSTITTPEPCHYCGNNKELIIFHTPCCVECASKLFNNPKPTGTQPGKEK